MPVNMLINPDIVRKTGSLHIPEIPLCTYKKTLKDVRKEFPNEDLVNMYRDMRLIREFEYMVQGVRTIKEYRGVQYAYTGPAHLSIGQEASAVGQAYVLDMQDYSFGTHRSHGEVLARGLIAIRRLSEERLLEIMRNFREGKLLKQTERLFPDRTDIRELALDFFLYGFMTELFGREIGFTGGLGNSMHVFFTPFGIYPNNAIVGASGGIGAGAALYKKLSGEDGIVVVNSGDGSISTGPVWEAMNFATMDQFTYLWDEKYKGGLPIIFNFMNNSYAMSGQTSGETLGFDILARVGAAFNPSAMLSERIDGQNPFAVIDAFRRKKEAVLAKKGPVLLDTIIYRHTGHSVTDQNAYRSKEEMDSWKQVDCIQRFREDLVGEGLMTDSECDSYESAIMDRITHVLRRAIDLDESPRMRLTDDPDSIARTMFSNKKIRRMSDRKPETIGPKEENSRSIKNRKKSRKGIDESGKPVSPLKVFSYRDAIFESLLDKFYEDPTMILFGEDVREHGNSFGVLANLYESVPRHRLFNAPIAEAAIISTAVGYAICGGRAVPEIMWCDFLGRCADELFNQLAKWQGMSAGILQMPCVVRVSVGAFYGAQHSQDWSSLATHIPGLKVMYPATPYDAKGLLNTALSSSDPVMFFESQKLYDIGELFAPEGVPEHYYEVPPGLCDIKRTGDDLTILTIGPALYPAIEAAKELSARWHIESEVIDTRTLVPFDYETVLASVRKTGKIVIVHDACERGGYAKTLSSNITEFAFDDLDAPPVSLGSHNWVSPAPELEQYFFPSKDMIIDAVHERIKPLEGYAPRFNMSLEEKMRHEKLGI